MTAAQLLTREIKNVVKFNMQHTRVPLVCKIICQQWSIEKSARAFLTAWPGLLCLLSRPHKAALFSVRTTETLATGSKWIPSGRALFSECSLLHLLEGERTTHCHIWIAVVKWCHPVLFPSVNGRCRKPFAQESLFLISFPWRFSRNKHQSDMMWKGPLIKNRKSLLQISLLPWV